MEGMFLKDPCTSAIFELRDSFQGLSVVLISIRHRSQYVNCRGEGELNTVHVLCVYNICTLTALSGDLAVEGERN